MSNSQEKNSPLIILLLTILLLIIISFLPKDAKIAGIPVKPVDLFMDVKPDSLLNFNDAGFDNPSLFMGKVNSDLILDLIEKVKGVLFNTAFNEYFSGNTAQMSFFYDALKNVKSKNVRIAHFGDSEIEGDLITADLRRLLQQKYGGNGAGFLSITSQDITFRNSTKQTFSDNWKINTLFAGGDKSLPVGISGTIAVPVSGSWVKYETTGNFNLKTFNKVRIYYSNAVKSSLRYSFNNGADQSADLQTGTGIKELVLNAGSDVKSVKITCNMSNQVYLYGVSLESGNGVYVDNFPWRGNSGVGFRDITEKNLSDFNSLLHYDLIILSFGGNMVNAQNTDFSWYENQMIKVVNSLKSIFPKTSIVLVSVGDKSIKKGTRFLTDPSVLKILEAQKSVASKTGIVFWNLFQAMGGENSMEKWVNSNPPLAFKDYTHVTQQGAVKIAELLSQAIIK